MEDKTTTVLVYGRPVTFANGILYKIVFARGDQLGFRSEQRAIEGCHKYRGFKHKIVDHQGTEYQLIDDELLAIPLWVESGD